MLLLALRDTGTKAWELSDLAGVLNIESWEVKVPHADVAHVILFEGFL